MRLMKAKTQQQSQIFVTNFYNHLYNIVINSSARQRKFFFLSPQIRNQISMFLIRHRKFAIARLKA